MKKTLIILLSAFIFACNSSEEDKAATGTENTEKKAEENTGSTLPPGITQADYDKGLTLVATSDCVTCHKINEKFQGPAYADVAKKYEPTEENITMLAGKVINGGTGVWGSIPMTAHPDITEEDAKAMVKYVLALKNSK